MRNMKDIGNKIKDLCNLNNEIKENSENKTTEKIIYFYILNFLIIIFNEKMVV